MVMPAHHVRWTREQVLALPDDGKRYELVDGALLVTPSPVHAHQRALLRVLAAVQPYVYQFGLGEMLWSPADLAFGEDEILQPDLFVVPAAFASGRVPWSDITRLLLVVEVLSPSTARADRTIKRRRFQRAGIPEYWIVDLDARVVERWRPGDERPEVLAETLSWQPTVAVPPLAIDLPALFASVWD